MEWAAGAVRNTQRGGVASEMWVASGQGPLTGLHNQRSRGPLHTSHVGPHVHQVLSTWLQPIQFSHRGFARNQLRFLWAWK